MRERVEASSQTWEPFPPALSKSLTHLSSTFHLLTQPSNQPTSNSINLSQAIIISSSSQLRQWLVLAFTPAPAPAPPAVAVAVVTVTIVSGSPTTTSNSNNINSRTNHNNNQATAAAAASKADFLHRGRNKKQARMLPTSQQNASLLRRKPQLPQPFPPQHHPSSLLHSTAGTTTPPPLPDLVYTDTDIDTDDTLTMAGCDEPCDNCSTGSSGGCAAATSEKPGTNRLIDIEDYEAELTKLRARAKELEEAMAKARIDGATTNKATTSKPKLRSTDWFNRKTDLGMTALYIERYLNMGFTREELMSGKPIIGIAQSGSDIAPVSFFLTSKRRK